VFCLLNTHYTRVALFMHRSIGTAFYGERAET
jgi:hypothetical protein